MVSQSRHLDNQNNAISLQACKIKTFHQSKEIKFIRRKRRRTVDAGVEVSAVGWPNLIAIMEY
jgi:hypothetical protein